MAKLCREEYSFKCRKSITYNSSTNLQIILVMQIHMKFTRQKIGKSAKLKITDKVHALVLLTVTPQKNTSLTAAGLLLSEENVKYDTTSQ